MNLHPCFGQLAAAASCLLVVACSGPKPQTLPDSARAVEVPPFTYLEIDSTKQKWGDWAEPDWLRYFGQDARDADGDGDLDILSGRYLYRNPGGDMSAPWTRIALDDNVDGILLLDVDGDAQLDIIAQALPDVLWYEATDRSATAFVRRKVAEVPATSHVNSQGFERAQMVPGGREEILLAGDGDIYQIEIPERPDRDAWRTTLLAANTSDEGIGFGDWDGDGDLDLAAGRRPPDGEYEPKILVLFENPGDGSGNWTATEIGTSVHPIDRVEIADLNGDGRPDVVATEERYPGEEPDGNFWWWEQPAAGAAGTWTRHRITTQYSMNNLDLTDFDGDGDVDLLTNEHKGPKLELQLWLNDGAGVFTKHVLDTGKENHLGTQFADLDNDGDLDIFGGGWDHHKYMHVWRNDQIRGDDGATGATFRELNWAPSDLGLEEEFLRVGGKYDYRTADSKVAMAVKKNGKIPLAGTLVPERIQRAELIVERVQSHEDTKHLQIQLNDGPWLDVPEPAAIPGRAVDYMFHSNVRVPVPLATLRPEANTFRFRMDTAQAWGWPQNLVYGLTLRAHEKPSTDLLDFSIRQTPTGVNQTRLELTTDRPDAIESVTYLAHATDLNWRGDGVLEGWQYRMNGGRVDGAIGTATTAPFAADWNTEWLPNQTRPVQLSARVRMRDGTLHFLPAQDMQSRPPELRRDYVVDLIMPYDLPAFWVTRGGEYGQKFDLDFDPAQALAARVEWLAWSPCYSAGITVNGRELPETDKGPCYRQRIRRETLPLELLQRGTNTLRTLKTPLHDGHMVHGMEVQYPGFVIKVKRPRTASVSIRETTYEGRPHYLVRTPTANYYLDRAGGGLSRLIDPAGNDWIDFRREPWNEYPASAASAYRGLPNLVFGGEYGGAGHPGHDQMESMVVGPNQIRSRTPDGAWSWLWTFDAFQGALTVEQTPDGAPYWFLYEGTPGGFWDPANYYYVTGDDLRVRHETPDFYKHESHFGTWPTVAFGHRASPHALFIEQASRDALPDVVGYLGNSDAGVASKNGMVVAGLGRNAQTEPLLTGRQTFRFGLVPAGLVLE